MQGSRRARELRRNHTHAERLLWRHLRNRQLAGLKFRRRYPLGTYIVDFVCMDRRLIVELDGSQHAARSAADARRDAWLREQGFVVMRFWNKEVLENLDAILGSIADASAD